MLTGQPAGAPPTERVRRNQFRYRLKKTRRLVKKIKQNQSKSIAVCNKERGRGGEGEGGRGLEETRNGIISKQKVKFSVIEVD